MVAGAVADILARWPVANQSLASVLNQKVLDGFKV